MVTILEIFFSFILLISILREVKRLDFIWESFPLFMQYIPSWSFFAPIPNMFDYHLLYREISHDGKVYDWQQVYSVEDKRPFLSFIWHPEKRFSKAFLDIAIDLVRFSNKIKDKGQIYTSLPYLLILNHVDSLCRNNKKIQFVILTNSRVLDYEVAFLSGVHPVGSKE